MFTGSLAHIYIGTIGSEGSLESMTTGYVDENWAEAHLDLWYAEATGREKPEGTHGAGHQDPASMQAPPDRA
jgi:formate dehydrogenase subunit gamma